MLLLSSLFLKIAMLGSSSQSQCCFRLHNHNAAFFFITISMLFVSSQYQWVSSSQSACQQRYMSMNATNSTCNFSFFLFCTFFTLQQQKSRLRPA
jgi:hypothetical protein